MHYVTVYFFLHLFLRALFSQINVYQSFFIFLRWLTFFPFQSLSFSLSLCLDSCRTKRSSFYLSFVSSQLSFYIFLSIDSSANEEKCQFFSELLSSTFPLSVVSSFFFCDVYVLILHVVVASVVGPATVSRLLLIWTKHWCGLSNFIYTVCHIVCIVYIWKISR